MEVIHFLSEHFKENVRQMEGALNRVYTYSRLINKPLDVILAREILKDLIKSEKAKRITIEEILQKVGQFYKITILQMQGPKRLKNFVFPRQVAMYISRNLTDLSLPEIGDAFGGRDHTTVLHACRTIKRKMENSQVLKDEINRISQSLVNS
jgi:chromosomal replication initiator protein